MLQKKEHNIFLRLILPGLILYGCSLFSQRLKSHNQEDSSRIKIHRLNINTRQSEYSPFLFQNKLYFVSDRDHYTGLSYEEKNTNKRLSDIFVSERKDSLRYSGEAALKELNTRYNEGPCCFSSTGDAIFFTSSAKVGENNLLRISYCSIASGKMSEAKVLPFCFTEHHYCHPALFAGDRKIIFSSNMPGGKGGMDLYTSTLICGTWTRPVNLWELNSEADDAFPFVSAGGKLYFASNRKGGHGGLDIYSSSVDSPSTFTLLGWPFNTKADDFGIWTDSTGENGYLSSNRHASRNDDIFYYNTWIPDFSQSKKPVVKTSFCYTFFEEYVMKSRDSSNIRFEWDFGDGSKARTLLARHCYAKPGRYNVNLNITEMVEGEKFKTQTNYVLEVENPPQLFIDCCDTACTGNECAFSSEKSGLKGYKIEKVFWSFGDGSFNAGPVAKHNYKHSGNYQVELLVEALNEKTSRKEKFKIAKNIKVKSQ